MSDLLFGLALVWFCVMVVGATRPFPWLVLAAFVALAALARFLGY